MGGGGAGLFLKEKRATVLKEAGVEGDGAGRVAPPNATAFPSISDLARAAEVAREAIIDRREEAFRDRETLKQRVSEDERCVCEKAGDMKVVSWI